MNVLCFDLVSLTFTKYTICLQISCSDLLHLLFWKISVLHFCQIHQIQVEKAIWAISLLLHLSLNRCCNAFTSVVMDNVSVWPAGQSSLIRIHFQTEAQNLHWAKRWLIDSWYDLYRTHNGSTDTCSCISPSIVVNWFIIFSIHAERQFGRSWYFSRPTSTTKRCHIFAL